ncbi:MAG: hypothetical protein QOG20_2535, partial [Pseudonocardiales bacterium]|nr:hypothetical protein [Pseudonocardiales bacterium]
MTPGPVDLNTGAATTVRRNGMERVGKTGKYFGLDLQVFRLRHADFDPSVPVTSLPRTPPPSDGTDRRQRATVAAVSGCRPDLAAEAGSAARSKRAMTKYRCGMALGKNKADVAPPCLGRRPDRTSDRVTRRAQCAVSLGLGVST